MLAIIAVACGSPGRSPAPSPASSPSVPVGTPQVSTVPSAVPVASTAPAANDRPALVRVGRFDQPVYLTSPKDDPRLFVVEQTGTIRVISDGKTLADPFLDISKDVLYGGERGLFSIAFAPNFAQSRLFYVSYTDRGGDNRIDEFKVQDSDPNRADLSSRRLILHVDHPYPNHNGGLIAFDPTGMLMIGLGDGGSRDDPGNRAQNLGVLLGKLLRIDPSKPSAGKPYGIPADNSFVSKAGAMPEIWAYGLRNPWRWWFDPATRDLFIADVGQDHFEEIDYVPPTRQPGANYGWRKYEGDDLYIRQSIDESHLVMPILTISHSSGNICSVTGGAVYRGEVQSLKGFYLYGDYCEGVIKGFKVIDGRAVQARSLGLKVPSLSSFGEDSKGELYALSLTGDVYRIAKAA
jgi:glucose/arabinose dehydrogenase